MGSAPITKFEDWYVDYDVDPRDGTLSPRGIAACGSHLNTEYLFAKREMDIRVAGYDKLEKLADGQVIKEKADLPNVSSGETAGLVRRIARNLVQNTPNVEILSKFDDDGVKGIFANHILKTKIIGSDEYSNDMQQNLFASTKTALTLGFDAVVPVLLQDHTGSWYMKYDTLHYRDVFPEPGCKDVRQATEVYVRRYLTKGEVNSLIRDNTDGWDMAALRTMLQSAPYSRARESVDHQTAKHGQIPRGYEVITWYSSSGDPFLTFDPHTKALLRIEKNKHPQKLHPVHFLVLEKDAMQPLGKSQVELVIGRQDFQDLMLNGAMKLWYRNINPSIIGYGAVNAVPNLSPGKYTSISNPNAKIEPFEVSTATLNQFGLISQQNLGSMVNLMGSADQQMATQAGNGMSATPQGFEAQQQMVDITTNNFQKAIESFFSHYCSYALTVYFAELRATKKVVPSADAREKLLEAGLSPEEFNEDGSLAVDFSELVVPYYVRVVPGSLVEMEDEKQLRVLNELFVPLSQAMPALAAVQDRTILNNAAKTMQFIIGKQIELSGATTAKELGMLWTGKTDEAEGHEAMMQDVKEQVDNFGALYEEEQERNSQAIVNLQAQVSQLTQLVQTFMEKVGVQTQAPVGSSPQSPENPDIGIDGQPTVDLASA